MVIEMHSQTLCVLKIRPTRLSGVHTEKSLVLSAFEAVSQLCTMRSPGWSIGNSACVSDPRPSKRRCVTTAPRPLARGRPGD